MSQIAFNTKVETPEGPFTIKTVLKSPTAVMTRTDDGQVRFAMSEPGEVTEGQKVLAIALDNGKSFGVGPDQLVLKKGMEAVAAKDLAVGDRLESVFAFPAGYTYKTDGGEEVESDGTVGVTKIGDGGEAEVHAISVPMTGRFAFSCGVLGVA